MAALGQNGRQRHELTGKSSAGDRGSHGCPRAWLLFTGAWLQRRARAAVQRWQRLACRRLRGAVRHSRCAARPSSALAAAAEGGWPRCCTERSGWGAASRWVGASGAAARVRQPGGGGGGGGGGAAAPPPPPPPTTVLLLPSSSVRGEPTRWNPPIRPHRSQNHRKPTLALHRPSAQGRRPDPTTSQPHKRTLQLVIDALHAVPSAGCSLPPLPGLLVVYLAAVSLSTTQRGEAGRLGHGPGGGGGASFLSFGQRRPKLPGERPQTRAASSRTSG